MSMITVKKVDPRERAIIALIEGLEAYNRHLYPDFFSSGLRDYTVEELSQDDVYFAAAFTDAGIAVGIGAVKYFKEEKFAEITRVFVREDFRRQGIGLKMVQVLEGKARSEGYAVIKLESGIRQPEAIKLYEKLGYRRISEGFGHHTNTEHSALYFMQKELLQS